MPPLPSSPRERWRLLALTSRPQPQAQGGTKGEARRRKATGFTPILAALPTMLIAALAAWILASWLAVRDRLGHWHLTARDVHGAVVGHGEVDLVARHWTIHWSHQPPFLCCLPAVDPQRCGSIDLSASAMRTFARDQAATCPLSYAQCNLLPSSGRIEYTLLMTMPMPGRDMGIITWPNLPEPGAMSSCVMDFNNPGPPAAPGTRLTISLTR